MLSRAKGHAARIAMTLAASVLALASSIVALPPSPRPRWCLQQPFYPPNLRLLPKFCP